MPTSPQQKFVFLTKMYFAVTNNPSDDVNPFIVYSEFLPAKVKDLTWGLSPEAINAAKQRFAINYSRVLVIYGVALSADKVFKELLDNRSNEEVVQAWIKTAKFPG